MSQRIPALPPLDSNALSQYERGIHPDAPIRLGLIHNPGAGRTQRWRDRIRLAQVLPNAEDIITTRHESEVHAALRRLLLERGVNTIGIHGGDGTIHTVLNAMWDILDELATLCEQRLRPPAFLFLTGGTMNMTARAMHSQGGVTATLAAFQKKTRGETFQQLNTHPLPVLRVDDGVNIRRGLIFGSELVYNALGLHRHFGDGYMGLSRLLFKASFGAAFKTKAWEQLSPLLNPPNSPVRVDSVTYPHYAAVVASTVDLMLAKGWVSGLKVDSQSKGFTTKLILETHKSRLVNLVPTLLRNRRHPKIVDTSDTEILRVKGPYTLDGELFQVGPEHVITVKRDSGYLPVIQESH